MGWTSRHRWISRAAIHASGCAADLQSSARRDAERPEREIASENGANGHGVRWNDDKLFRFGPIAERHGRANPEPFALRGCDLVAHTLADHLTLELREGQKHVERQPACDRLKPFLQQVV